ncbi:hypothetical protein ABK040_010364 [Willaertia magna]
MSLSFQKTSSNKTRLFLTVCFTVFSLILLLNNVLIVKGETYNFQGELKRDLIQSIVKPENLNDTLDGIAIFNYIYERNLLNWSILLRNESFILSNHLQFSILHQDYKFNLEKNITKFMRFDFNTLSGTMNKTSDKLKIIDLFKNKYNLEMKVTLMNVISSSQEKPLILSKTIIQNKCKTETPMYEFILTDWKPWIVSIVVLGMLILLVFEVYKPYFIIFLALVIFTVLDIISIKDALNGFGNEGMITVGLLFPIVTPLGDNALLLRVTRLVFGSPKYPRVSLLRITIPIVVLSAFLNNTPIVVAFIPLIKDWCREYGLSASKFLIPLSYATIGGGLITLIGTSTNLVASGLLVTYNYPPFGFFEFAYIGLILTFATLLYLVTIGYWLLPNKKGGLFRYAMERGEQFLSQLVVTDKNLVGKTPKKVVNYLGLPKLEIIEIVRPKEHLEENGGNEMELIVPVPNDFTIKHGDHIVFRGNPDDIMKLHSITKVSDRVKEEISTIQVMLGTNELSKCSEISSTDPNQNDDHTENDIEVIHEENVVVEMSQEHQEHRSHHHRTGSLDNEDNNNTALQTFMPRSELERKLREERKSFDITARSRSNSDLVPLEVSSIRKARHSIDTPTITIDSLLKEGSQVNLLDTKERNTMEEQEQQKEKEDNSPRQMEKKEEEEEKKEEKKDSEPEFFEVVISSSNPCSGEKYLSFGKHYQCVILAVRHREKTEAVNFKDLTVQAGDTLLIISKSEFYDKFKDSRDFYVISRCNVTPKYKRKFIVNLFGREFNLWWWEHLIFPIFIAMIACATADIPMLKCTMVALSAMILLKLISPVKAVSVVDWQLLILVGSSFGIGQAIRQAGIGEAIAGVLYNVPTIILPSLVFLICQIISAVITNNAAVVICLPIAMAIAEANKLNPRVFAMCTAIASSADFSTPIGYQTNLLVQGPGGYSFMDYVKVGLPLNIIYWILSSIFIPLIWGLETPNF